MSEMSPPRWAFKRGSELSSGDAVSTWWRPGGAMLYDIKAYTGTLLHLFPSGASIGIFAADTSSGSVPMTIDHGEVFKVRVPNMSRAS